MSYSDKADSDDHTMAAALVFLFSCRFWRRWTFLFLEFPGFRERKSEIRLVINLQFYSLLLCQSFSAWFVLGRMQVDNSAVTHGLIFESKCDDSYCLWCRVTPNQIKHSKCEVQVLHMLESTFSRRWKDESKRRKRMEVCTVNLNQQHYDLWFPT